MREGSPADFGGPVRGKGPGRVPACGDVHAGLSRAVLAEGARRSGPAPWRVAEAVRWVALLAAVGLAAAVLILLALLGLEALWEALGRPPRPAR